MCGIIEHVRTRANKPQLDRHTESESPMAQPNILLIMTDQQALHALSCYGAPICKTPKIDALAADGVRFTRAYTPIALCTPARASLLTGLYPHNHGALYNTGTHLPFDEERTGAGLEMYPHRLKAAGYNLGYAGKWHAGVANTARDVGFEGYGPQDYGDVYGAPEYRDYLRERELDPPEAVFEFDPERGKVRAWDNESGYLNNPTAATPSRFVADTALGLIDKFSADDQPFFVVCSFWGPHAPYLPSAEFKDMYDPADIAPWANFADDLADKPMVHKKYRTSVFPAAAEADWETWSQVIARYYGFASMIDAEIGRMLNQLKAQGLYDEMVIIFASDHGDTIGIHGGAFDKGAMAYEEVYHIPLIVKQPGSVDAGSTRAQLVTLLDLTETFCQLAQTSMHRTDGQSLLPILADADYAGREQLVSQFHGHRLPVGQRILWWRQYKYVFNFADTDELYDLTVDPAEVTNLIDDDALIDVRREMRARLLAEMNAVGDTLGPQSTFLLTRPLQV